MTYVENPCDCGHSKNMHYYNKETHQLESCMEPQGYNGDEVDMCVKYRAAPPKKARFDLNGLVLDR